MHQRVVLWHPEFQNPTLIESPARAFELTIFTLLYLNFSEALRDHSFKTSACLRGGGVSPCADGPKVTVHKDQKSPS